MSLSISPGLPYLPAPCLEPQHAPCLLLESPLPLLCPCARPERLSWDLHVLLTHPGLPPPGYLQQQAVFPPPDHSQSC